MDGAQERDGEHRIAYLQQRECIIDSYLRVLDLEVEDLERDDDERLRSHARMERELVRMLEELTRKIDEPPPEKRIYGAALSFTSIYTHEQ